MICIGRTKKSNYLKRCNNQTKFLFCKWHIWQPLLVISIIITLFYNIISISGYSIKDIIIISIGRANPNISVTMEYPIEKDKNDNYGRNKRNPEIRIYNDGPTKAISLSGNLKVYAYNNSIHDITNYTTQGFDNTEHALFREELKQFHAIKQKAINITGDDIITAIPVMTPGALLHSEIPPRFA